MEPDPLPILLLIEGNRVPICKISSEEKEFTETGQSTRTKPSARPKPPETVNQTDLNQYIRKQEDKGGRVSEPLKDTAGVDDAARRGDIKPVQAGESKPTAPQGRVSRVRLKGVNISPEQSS